MPSAVWYANGTQIKDNVKYTYDKCGNISEVRENGALVARYAYDSLNRLIREDNKLLSRTTLFAYDGTGNIISKRTTAFTLKSNVEECEFTSFEYGYEGDRLVSYNGELCKYNGLGSPTKYRDKTATWKYGKLLTELDGTTFTYDGLGRRTRKGNIQFVYDNDGHLIKQSNSLEFIYDHSGVTGFKYNSTQYFYRKDVQGNITAILDSTGNIVVRYNYNAWGNYSITGNEQLGNLNPFRYRGYYYDTETNLYYLQTRYYDPETGRFISQDSIEYADPESINGLNLYAYCGNNPVMNVDPTGHKWWHWVVGIALVVATTVAVVATAGLAATVLGVSAGVATSMCVGAGVATATAGIANLASQASKGVEEFDLGSLMFDMVLSGTVGMITGGIGAAIGTLSAGASVGTKLLVHMGMQIGANTVLSLGAYSFQSAIRGDQMTLYGTGIAVMSGMLSGLLFNSSSWSSFILTLGTEIAGYGESIFEVIKNYKKRIQGMKI